MGSVYITRVYPTGTENADSITFDIENPTKVLHSPIFAIKSQQAKDGSALKSTSFAQVTVWPYTSANLDVHNLERARGSVGSSLVDPVNEGGSTEPRKQFRDLVLS